MKKTLKRAFKRNSHATFFKSLAGFGRSLNRFYENRNHDVYSNGEFSILKKLAKLDPKMVIDGGANIGKYSKLTQEACPGIKVYAFEPVPATFELLSENVKCLKSVQPIKKGLFKEEGELEINLFSSNTHSSIVDIQGLNYESTGKTTIELVKGDDFFKQEGIESIDLLKLDLEGVELDALYGFGEMLDQVKIRMIQFEYGYINITTKNLLIDFYNFFESKGYILGKIFPKTVEFREYKFKYEDFLGPNFIAVLKNDTELINLLKSK